MVILSSPSGAGKERLLYKMGGIMVRAMFSSNN
jgi:guanylate kinase